MGIGREEAVCHFGGGGYTVGCLLEQLNVDSQTWDDVTVSRTISGESCCSWC